jgi:hypothetical protein
MNSAAPQEAAPAHPWEDLEATLCGESTSRWAERCEAASQNEFHRVLLVLARHATNDQFRDLFSQLDHVRFPHREQLLYWRRTLAKFTPSLFSSGSRYRRRHSDRNDHRLILFSCQARPSRPTQAATIIAFTDKSGLLMAPVPCILQALAANGHDLVVIRRRWKTSYLDDDGRLLGSIREHLRSTLRGRLQRSLTLGSSQGGLAALCTAHALGLRLGVAISAVATAASLEPGGALRRASLRQRQPGVERQPGTRPLTCLRRRTRLLIAAAQDHAIDRESALRISQRFNSSHPATARATAVLFQGCGEHVLLPDLAARGVSLEQLLPALLRQDLQRLPPHRSAAGGGAPQ